MGKDPYRPVEIFRVEQGFSHAHEHDIGEAFVPQGEEVVLFYYLRGFEVAYEPHGPGSAEGAPHGASDLGREARGFSSLLIGEQDRFDGCSVCKVDTDLFRAVVAPKDPGRPRCPYGTGAGKAVSQGFREIRHFPETLRAPVYPPEDLGAPESGFIGEQSRYIFRFKS